jgi:hypothetical protein
MKERKTTNPFGSLSMDKHSSFLSKEAAAPAAEEEENIIFLGDRDLHFSFFSDMVLGSCLVFDDQQQKMFVFIYVYVGIFGIYNAQ